MEKKEKKRHKIHDRKVELYDTLNNQKDTCFKKILYLATILIIPLLYMSMDKEERNCSHFLYSF